MGQRKNDLEVVKLARAYDGTVTVSNRAGYALDMAAGSEQANHVAKYFEGEAEAAWMLGKFFAPTGSSKRTKLMLVRRATEAERW